MGYKVSNGKMMCGNCYKLELIYNKYKVDIGSVKLGEYTENHYMKLFK